MLKQQKMHEYEVLKNLHHPNIVHLCEVIDDIEAKEIYIVFIFLTGQSL